MILDEELIADFLPLARLILDSHPEAEFLKRPLAQLLAASGQGIGRLPRTLCTVPDHAPREFFALRGEMVLLPRNDAFWQSVRSRMEELWRSPGTPFEDQAVHDALNAILRHELLNDPATGALLFDNAQQRLAVAALVDARLGVLTGGPGTGKSASAAALLAVRKRLNPELLPQDVLLCAPTGKAACRLAESMKQTADRLTLRPEEQKFLKTIQPKTLHRALEWSPLPPEKGGPFRRNRTNPLQESLVLVDEAGMVDLSLFSHLLDALPQHASLLVLGDRDQLESVETGGVLAELVARGSAGHPPAALLARWSARTGREAETIFRAGLPQVSVPTDVGPLDGLIVGLKDSFRAKSAPGILALASLLRPGRQVPVERIYACFEQFSDRLHWHTSHRSFDRLCREQWTRARQDSAGWTTKLRPEESVLREHLGRFQLLCGTNEQVEKGNDAGLRLLWQDSPAQSDLALPHGCPVMVGVNRPILNLSNGDIGLALGDGPGRAAQLVLFPDLKPLPFHLLPEHRPAFALTIHKSQGSEWQHVAIDLPETGAILTPNLLYTAVTRSSQHLNLYGKRMELLADILYAPASDQVCGP